MKDSGRMINSRSQEMYITVGGLHVEVRSMLGLCTPDS